MNLPRSVVFYTDGYGNSPVAEQLDDLASEVVDKIQEKIHLLETYPWNDLFKSRLVKELKGADRLYECRISGRGAVRITFFTSTCRGENEIVFLDCERRSDLAGRLWKVFIKRAERLRADWERRNCGGSRAR